MNDWWKAPILQGVENDNGDYDYLIEKMPSDYVKWQYDKYPCHCDSCGKESHLVLYSVQHFYTLDGWDSLDSAECWRCNIGDKIWSIKQKVKRHIEAFKLARKLYKADSTRPFKFHYELVKKIVR